MPTRLAEIERKKRRAQRGLARRKRGSARHAKTRHRIAALQAKAVRIRQDWRHKASIDIARRFGTVVLEDLAARRMTHREHGMRPEPMSVKRPD